MATAMNRRMVARAVVLGSLLLAGTLAIAAEPFRRIKGPQIKARFAGMEMTDRVHWRDVYERDGTIRSISLGRASQGKWWVQGDELCQDLGKEQGCYEVWISGNKVELRREGIESAYLEGVLDKPSDPK